MNDDQEQALAQHDAAERAAQEAVRAFGRQLLDWAQSDAGQAWIRLVRKDKAMSDTATNLTNRMLAERAGLHGERQPDGSGRLVGPDGKWYVEWPDYRGSVEAALTLTLPAGYSWGIEGTGDYWTALILNDDGYSDDRITARGNTAAEAVCRVWWQFMQMQDTQEGA